MRNKGTHIGREREKEKEKERERERKRRTGMMAHWKAKGMIPIVNVKFLAKQMHAAWPVQVAPPNH